MVGTGMGQCEGAAVRPEAETHAMSIELEEGAFSSCSVLVTVAAAPASRGESPALRAPPPHNTCAEDFL